MMDICNSLQSFELMLMLHICRSSGTNVVESPTNDPELTLVSETPGINCMGETTPEVHSRNDFSSPRATSAFAQQSSSHSISLQDRLSSPTKLTFSEAATPEQETHSTAENLEPEAESPWSVNSILKRRKITSLHEFSTLASSITTVEATRNRDKAYHSEKDCRKLKPSLSTPSSAAVSHISSDLEMEEGLQIFCSHCKNPLGLPENDLLVKCSDISTSKTHLISLQNKTPGPEALRPSSVDVLVSDASSVHPRVLASQESTSGSGQGIWCKEDGCVFNSIFCPFCLQSDNCIAVHVVATDALNTEFQNKVRVFMLPKKIRFFLWLHLKIRFILYIHLILFRYCSIATAWRSRSSKQRSRKLKKRTR